LHFSDFAATKFATKCEAGKSDMAGKVRHLLNRSGRYCARVSVPATLRPILGKRELLEPLGADRKQALQKQPAAVARMQAILDAARVQARSPALPTLNRPLYPKQLARAHYEAELERDEAARLAAPNMPDDFDQAEHNRMFIPAYADALKRVASGYASNLEIGAVIGWAFDGFEARGNTSVKRYSPEWRELCRNLAGVQLEALKRTQERDQGDYAGTPTHPVLTQPEPKPSDPLMARIVSPDSTKTLGELLPAFLAERKASQAMQHEHVVSVRMFDEFTEGAKLAHKITRKDVHEYKRALMEAPSNYTKRFPGMTLPDAIRTNKKRLHPHPALDPKTINDKWLSRLHALLNWCVRNDILPDNPAAGIKVEYTPSTKPPRVPFSPGDLAKIFAKPLFDPAKPWGETEWAMLVSLFAGTRPSELAQMQLDSIRTERGVLIFAIEGETKNAGSQRLIPVHPSLLNLGLEQHVANLRGKGATHLFPEWYQQGQAAKRKAERRAKDTGVMPTLNQHYPKYLPKRVNVSYLPKIGVKEPQKNFYSFRHTFKTGLSLAGVEKSVRDYLCGHMDTSAGSVYVHDVSIAQMKAAIDRLHYDGFVCAFDN
jgi:integrase